MTTNPTEGTGRGDIVPLNLDSSGSEEEVDQGIGDSVDELFNLPSHGGNPVEVKRKNKIICTTAYTVLILWMVAYIVWLYVTSSYHKEVAYHTYFAEPIVSIYVIFGTDIIASIAGIWTCLAKTGPKPMIFVCIWLLLSSLVNLGVTLSLLVESKSEMDARSQARKKSQVSTQNLTLKLVGSTAFYTTKAVIWCSIISVLFKFIVIGLCRFNYPQVFNWMVGKHVYVDEKLVETLDPTIGGGMFDVCDIARLSARGSTGGKVRKLPDQRTYVVTQKSETDLTDDNVRHSNESDGTAIKVKPTRRPTLVSLTSNASSMFLTLKSAGGSGQIL